MNHTMPKSSNPVFELNLQDTTGTGYHLTYRQGSNTLSYDMFDCGALLYGESIQSNAQSIKNMMRTALRAGMSINADKANGTVGTRFTGSFARLAGMLQMNFRLADRSSNADVLCTLDMVHQDIPDLLGLGVAFVIPSDSLLQSSTHLSAL